MRKLLFGMLAIVLLAGASCTKREEGHGFVTLKFVQTDLKYFISNIALEKSDGSIVSLFRERKAYYIDHRIPQTLTFELPDSVPCGVYKGISFTFGLEEAINTPLLFPTPPECYMQTPDELGGGYNYLQMNGKYAGSFIGQKRDYNFYLGMGVIRPSSGLGSDETTFVHNNFEVEIHDIKFEMDQGEEVVVSVVMEVNNWFHDPHLWDFHRIGGNISGKQDAQLMARENGHDVFSAYVESATTTTAVENN